MTRLGRMKLTGSLLAVGACLAFGNSAQAQDVAQASAPESAGAPAIGEIVITARKRSENLQDVPASIIAIGEGQIESLNAKSLTDLTRVTPNVQIDEMGSITIRGVHSFTRNAGFEAGAAVYIDGVYQGRPIGNNQDLVDVERVEVLRGPQGTLYGKNTTAGAISLVTARPGDSFTGKAEVQYGERDDFRVSGYVAGPLAEDLVGLKLSGFRHSADGYQKNIANGDRYGNIDAFGGRAELRFTPGSWDFALRGDFTRDDGEPAFSKVVAGFAAPFASGRDNVNYDVPGRLSHKGGGVSLTAEHEFDDYTFTSISAWRKLRATSAFDDDFTPLDIFRHDFVDKSEQLSQEVRLASPSHDALTYVVGAYYFNQNLKSDRPGFAGAAFPVQGVLDNDVKVETNAFAVFANADYRFTEQLILNLGLRYTIERKDLDFLQTVTPGLPFPNLDITDSFSDSDFSPTISLTYKITPDVTTYVKMSRGFKSGGWNPDISSTPDIAFDPETVTNYEAGLRTRMFGGRLVANLTGYYMDYKDLQVQEFVPVAGNRITNGTATIKGAELDVQIRPASWLNLSVGAAYTDAKYDDFNSAKGADYAGQQITDTPKFTGFASFDARFPISDSTDLIAQGDYSYRSKVFFDDDRTVTAGLPYASDGYGILNARLGVSHANFEFYVFGQNLTNKRVLTDRSSDALQLGLVLDTYGPPRQFGARLGYKF